MRWEKEGTGKIVFFEGKNRQKNWSQKSKLHILPVLLKSEKTP